MIANIWWGIKLFVSLMLFAEALLILLGVYLPAPKHVAFWAFLCGSTFMAKGLFGKGD